MFLKGLGILLVTTCLIGCESDRDRLFVEKTNAKLARSTAQATGSVAQQFRHVNSPVPGLPGVWIGKGKKIVVPGKFTPPKLIKVVHPFRKVLENPPEHDVLVVVQFVINKKGRVSHPEVVRTEEWRFEQPALEAVSRWRFEPATYEGDAVNSGMVVPMIFKKQENPLPLF